MVELALLGVFGVAMIAVGYYGLLVYARAFFGDPEATMSADLLLALIKGPGAVPAVLCAMLVFGGVWFVVTPIWFAFGVAWIHLSEWLA